MNERLESLRALMKKNGIDFYIIPNTDPHSSEYVSEHFRAVKFISGFTGSNATVVVTKNEAGLWTDGRYFVQAEKQLKDSDIDLYRMGVEGEPTIEEFIEKRAKKGDKLAYDGKLITKNEHDSYEKLVKKFKGKIQITEDLFSNFWQDRPKREANPIYILDTRYSGKDTAQKVTEIRGEMKKAGVNGLLVNDLCDIAWLLNLRGSDITDVAVFFSYLYLDDKGLFVFLQRENATGDILSYLKGIKGLNVKILEYDALYKRLKKLKGKTIAIDPKSVNISMIKCIEKSNKVISLPSPISEAKAVKNKTEIENIKKSHLADSVALTKFIFGLKNDKYEDLTEAKVSDIVYELRSTIEGFVGESFGSIAAYGANAAMMHYSPSHDNPVDILKRGFLLLDSGGHYLDGTTDVTRTMAVGPLSKEEKLYYTMALKGHLDLMDARFKEGCSGAGLDILARGGFWREGLDYLCGTGHGVGYLLSVHEGPQNIGWKLTAKPAPLKEGMIVTDEPGFYEAGKFGIRIENELLVVPFKKTEYGTFLAFEPITYVPYERDAILEDMLTERQKEVFNAYNDMIYKKLSPRLTKEEAEWLFEVTKAI